MFKKIVLFSLGAHLISCSQQEDIFNFDKIIPVKTLQEIIFGYLSGWSLKVASGRHYKAVDIVHSADGLYIAWFSQSALKIKNTKTGFVEEIDYSSRDRAVSTTINALAWSPDGKYFALILTDQPAKPENSLTDTVRALFVDSQFRVELLDARTKNKLAGLNYPKTKVNNEVHRLMFSADSRYLSFYFYSDTESGNSYAYTPTIRTFDITYWKSVFIMREVRSKFAYSPDNRFLVFINRNGRIFEKAIGPQSYLSCPVGHQPSGEEEGYVRVCGSVSCHTAVTLSFFEHKAGMVEQLLYTPDGKYIIIQAQGKIHYWDRNQKKVTHGVQGNYIAYTPDGSHCAILHQDGTISIYNAKIFKKTRSMLSLMSSKDFQPKFIFPTKYLIIAFVPNGDKVFFIKNQELELRTHQKRN